VNIFIRLHVDICARAITATHRDYSTWTRWGRNSRSRRNNSCNNNSNDRCPRRERQLPLGNLRFLPKRFLHLRRPRPTNSHRVPILLQIRRLNIGCNEPRLRLLLRHSCQVRIVSHVNRSSGSSDRYISSVLML